MRHGPGRLGLGHWEVGVIDVDHRLAPLYLDQLVGQDGVTGSFVAYPAEELDYHWLTRVLEGVFHRLMTLGRRLIPLEEPEVADHSRP